MILALDIGNSQIYGGLFVNDEIQLRFRKTSKAGSSADEVGIFLRSVLRENGFDPSQVKKIAMCSVVPDAIYSLKRACEKYFNTSPFILQAGVKTGLKVCYRNPLEVGSDRIANAIGATFLFSEKNIVVVDLGTATTFCAINSKKEYLGGTIISGLRLNMESLESKTAKLPSVEIVSAKEALGKTTIESIQSGLYFGHLGAMKEVITQFTQSVFEGTRPFVIGTGGFSQLFEKEKIFDSIQPDLVLTGLRIALQYNIETRGEK